MDGLGTGSTVVVEQHIETAPPAEAAAASAAALGTREDVQSELDQILTEIGKFWSMEPDQVMRLVAAFSARCTELWVHLHRVEGRDRTYKQIRTMQVAPILEELDRQFRLASRQLEVRRQDLELMK